MPSMKYLAHARLSWSQVVDSLLGKRKTWVAEKVKHTRGRQKPQTFISNDRSRL
jgi:hypothetical protein